ncbi:universal stress global response regulator UspA [Vibrio albus]|uniref:Universal stress protein n=1 Tax=Vibrio albus TaxID=2200953 RepID=A0A2U3BDE4_9VIBR|nr:universal stress protein [Vibrio albus]PWI34818.1 universal stress global response regulator UspA [Vibrio albus]
MSYKHILVAVDLTDESRKLVEKATKLAKSLNAELSLIHVDVSFTETKAERIVARQLDKEQGLDSLVMKNAQELLTSLKDGSDYPIKATLISSGHIDDELEKAVQVHNIDLLICGHHQDFWHLFMSSAKKVMQHIGVDMLIVPFH